MTFFIFFYTFYNLYVTCVFVAASIPPEKYYSHLIESIKNLLDGQMDMQQYEDVLREMFTIKAFLAFTMDKFIPTMVKQVIYSWNNGKMKNLDSKKNLDFMKN